jgi:acetyltransferase
MTGTHPKVTQPRHTSLEAFFAPSTVAVFGASQTPGSVGRAVMTNLIRSPFGGTIIPITPKWPGVLGVKAYPDLAAVPMEVELAILATPAPTVPAILGDCLAAGVQAAIVLTAGFGDGDSAGAELERQIRALLRHGSMRVLGPNSIGVVCSRTGLNATFAPSMVRPGGVGFISQSGALLTALASGGLPEGVGCSAFISVGSMLDVDWADCLHYLAEDPQTESIGIYLESLGDASAFFAAVREVTPHKPVIVVKGGRTEATLPTGARLAQDEFLDAAFRRAGVLRVHTIADLFRMAELLASQPTPTGRRLTILSNARGPAVIATDALVADGGELAPLAPATLARLGELLPTRGNRQNPIDIGDDADLEQYAQAAAIAAQDPNTDALLIILTPQATIDPAQATAQLGDLARTSGKPILASWLWGSASPASPAALNRAGIPTFYCPTTAIRAFGYLWRHGYNLRTLWETEERSVCEEEPEPAVTERAKAAAIIHAARRSGRTVLTETEAEQLLAAYALPLAGFRTAPNEAEAVALAEVLGYPVLLKPLAEDDRCAADLNGVQLHADDPVTVRRAFRTLELIAHHHGGAERFHGVRVQPTLSPGVGCAIMLGSTTDPQLGPVLRPGAAGPWATAVGHAAVAFPPLGPVLVRQMIEQIAQFTAFGAAHRSDWVDRAALEGLLTRFSRLVIEQRWIKEISLNPLLASPERLIAVDARVVLHGPEVQEDQLPRPPFVLSRRSSKLSSRAQPSTGGCEGEPALASGRRLRAVAE